MSQHSAMKASANMLAYAHGGLVTMISARIRELPQESKQALQIASIRGMSVLS